MSCMAPARQLLPSFSADGMLPVGDYSMTLVQLAKSSLVRGASRRRSAHWDALWRARLVENLAVLVGELAQVGLCDIYINGSFVEAKDHPNDIDGYFVCDPVRFLSGRLDRELNRIAARPCWTWEGHDRRYVPGHGWKLPMWIEYRVELYPHFEQVTGIVDRFGNDLTFPAAFRLSRAGQPKGIVRLVR